MKEEIREVTVEELLELVKSQTGDFLIRVEPEKEETHGNEEIWTIVKRVDMKKEKLFWEPLKDAAPSTEFQLHLE